MASSPCPWWGKLKAEGRTPTELSEEIRTSLKAYVQEPRVTVIVREVNSSRVFITGEVSHPGAYPLRGRVSILQAIALAGGFTDFASRDSIRVLRGAGGEGNSIPVSYNELVQDSQRIEPLVLRPGDTIVVP